MSLENRLVSSCYKSPARLLDELGIVAPQDIDVEVVAQYTGATVIYEPLVGCAAQIIGYRDEAVIRVGTAASHARQRFSAAHELGHWMRDRHRVTSAFSCSDQEIMNLQSNLTNAERRADTFAADLLMPSHMFSADANGEPITFNTVDKLRGEYRTSNTATAIRLVEHSNLSGMLLWFDFGAKRWKWFRSGPLVPVRSLWPRDMPGCESGLHRVLDGSSDEEERDVSAETWFSDEEARRHYVREHTRRFGGQGASTLIWWENEAHLARHLI